MRTAKNRELIVSSATRSLPHWISSCARVGAEAINTSSSVTSYRTLPIRRQNQLRLVAVGLPSYLPLPPRAVPGHCASRWSFHFSYPAHDRQSPKRSVSCWKDEAFMANGNRYKDCTGLIIQRYEWSHSDQRIRFFNNLLNIPLIWCLYITDK